MIAEEAKAASVTPSVRRFESPPAPQPPNWVSLHSGDTSATMMSPGRSDVVMALESAESSGNGVSVEQISPAVPVVPQAIPPAIRVEGKSSGNGVPVEQISPAVPVIPQAIPPTIIAMQSQPGQNPSTDPAAPASLTGFGAPVKAESPISGRKFSMIPEAGGLAMQFQIRESRKNVNEAKNGDQGKSEENGGMDPNAKAKAFSNKKAVFAVGKHGITGMQGSKLTGGEKVNEKHTQKVQYLQMAPLWARLWWLRCTWILVPVLLFGIVMWWTSSWFTRIKWDSDKVRLPVPEKKVYNLEIHQLTYFSTAPITVSSDRCTIRLVNTCDNPDLECSKPSVNGEFRLLDEEDQAVMCGNHTGSCENVLVMKPTMSLSPMFGEFYYNRVLCNIVMVVEPEAEVHIRAHSLVLVAEETTLRGLRVTGVYGAPKEFVLVSDRLSIADDGFLALNASHGELSLANLEVADGAEVSISSLEASVDITAAFTPATLDVVSVNKAVCLAGPLAALHTDRVQRGNHTAVLYQSEWECAGSGCLGSHVVIESLGQGAVGFHVLSGSSDAPAALIPTPPSAPPNITAPEPEDGVWFAGTSVYAGQPFAKGFYTQVDYPEASELNIISLSGPGFMQGGVQVVWTKNSIWFAYPTLWVFWALSFTIVSPENPHAYPATVGFCPSHGPIAEKDLFAPLEELVLELGVEEVDEDGDGVVDPPPTDIEEMNGYFVLRNVGHIRDRMHPIERPDGTIPPCDYCDFEEMSGRSDMGSMKPEVNEELDEQCKARADDGLFENECSGECHMAKTVNRYTLVNEGDAPCYENWAVAATMGNNVTFDASFGLCWTSAEGSAKSIWGGMSSKCKEMANLFQRHLADFVLGLSVFIGFVGAGIMCWLFFGFFYPNMVALAMASMLTMHVGSIRQFSNTILWSRYFCVAQHWTERAKEENPNERPKEDKKRGGSAEEMKPLVADAYDEVTAIGRKDEVLNSEVIGVDFTWRTRWWFSGQRSGFEKMNVKDMVSENLIQKIAWLGALEVGPDSRRIEELDLHQGLTLTLWVRLRTVMSDTEVTRSQGVKVRDFVLNRDTHHKVDSAMFGVPSPRVSGEDAGLQPGEFKLHFALAREDVRYDWTLSPRMKHVKTFIWNVYDVLDVSNVQARRLFVSRPDGQDKRIRFIDGVQDPGVRDKEWEVLFVQARGRQSLQDEPRLPGRQAKAEMAIHIGVSDSGGVIRDLGEANIAAPAFVDKVGLYGRMRLSFVRPMKDDERSPTDPAATVEATGASRLVEAPMLQHGMEVDEAEWAEELKSGLVVVQKQVGRAGNAVTVCDLDATFAAFQKQAILTNSILQNLQRTFRIWFLLELSFGHIEPPAIADPEVAKIAYYHPYYHLAAEAYWSTVHSLKDEALVFAAHLAVCLLPSFAVFVFAICLFNVRLSEYGDQELDDDSQGWFIQDLLNVICVITVVINVISLMIYYCQNRTWGLKEVLVPDSRRSAWDTVKMLGGKIVIAILSVIPGTTKWKDKVLRQAFMQPVIVDSGRFKEVLLDQARAERESSKEGNKDQHWWFKFNKLEANLHDIFVGLCLFAILSYAIVGSVWITLGMFLNPNRVGPFFAAVVGFVFHVTSYYRSLMNFFNEAKLRLKEKIIEFREKLQQELMKKSREIMGDIEDKINSGVRALEAKTGLDVPELSLGGGGDDDDDDEGMVLPEFAKKLLEDVGCGKIKMEDLPERVKQDLYIFVNEELERLGFRKNLEFLCELGSASVKGDAKGVQNLLTTKLGELVMQGLESDGFPDAIRKLRSDVELNKDKLLQGADEIKVRTAKSIDHVIDNVLAPMGLAGPASLHPMLKTTLKDVMDQIVTEAQKASDGLDLAALNKFRDKVLEYAKDPQLQDQPLVSRMSTGAQRMIEEKVMGDDSSGPGLMEPLRLLMQLCSTTGTARERAQALWGTLFDFVLRQMDTEAVAKVLQTLEDGAHQKKEELTGRFFSEAANKFEALLVSLMEKLLGVIKDADKKDFFHVQGFQEALKEPTFALGHEVMFLDAEGEWRKGYISEGPTGQPPTFLVESTTGTTSTTSSRKGMMELRYPDAPRSNEDEGAESSDSGRPSMVCAQCKKRCVAFMLGSLMEPGLRSLRYAGAKDKLEGEAGAEEALEEIEREDSVPGTPANTQAASQQREAPTDSAEPRPTKDRLQQLQGLQATLAEFKHVAQDPAGVLEKQVAKFEKAGTEAVHGMVMGRSEVMSKLRKIAKKAKHELRAQDFEMYERELADTVRKHLDGPVLQHAQKLLSIDSTVAAQPLREAVLPILVDRYVALLREYVVRDKDEAVTYEQRDFKLPLDPPTDGKPVKLEALESFLQQNFSPWKDAGRAVTDSKKAATALMQALLASAILPVWRKGLILMKEQPLKFGQLKSALTAAAAKKIEAVCEALPLPEGAGEIPTSFKNLVKKVLLQIVEALGSGGEEALRTAARRAKAGIQAENSKAVTGLVRAKLTAAVQRFAQELFTDALRPLIEAKLRAKLSEWTAHSLSLDTIKADFLDRTEHQVEKFLAFLRKAGLPIPESLASDVRETLAGLMDKACSGALTAGRGSSGKDLSFGTIIAVANEFRNMSPEDLTARLKWASGNYLQAFIQNSLDTNVSMVKAVTAFGLLRRVRERMNHPRISMSRALLAQRQIQLRHVPILRKLLEIVERFAGRHTPPIVISPELEVTPKAKRFRITEELAREESHGNEHVKGGLGDKGLDETFDGANDVGDEFEEWWKEKKFLASKKMYRELPSPPNETWPKKKDLYEIALSLGMMVPGRPEKWSEQVYDRVGKEIVFAIQFHQKTAEESRDLMHHLETLLREFELVGMLYKGDRNSVARVMDTTAKGYLWFLKSSTDILGWAKRFQSGGVPGQSGAAGGQVSLELHRTIQAKALVELNQRNPAPDARAGLQRQLEREIRTEMEKEAETAKALHSENTDAANGVETLVAQASETLLSLAYAELEKFINSTADSLVSLLFSTFELFDWRPPRKTRNQLVERLRLAFADFSANLNTGEHPQFSRWVQDVLLVDKKAPDEDYGVYWRRVYGKLWQAMQSTFKESIEGAYAAWYHDFAFNGAMKEMVKEFMFEAIANELQAGEFGKLGGKIVADATGVSPAFVEKFQAISKAKLSVRPVTDLEVWGVLARVGLSQGHIIVLVSISAFWLILVFVFLFFGMAIFMGDGTSGAQAVINSLITGGAAIAVNFNSQAGDSTTKMMELLHKAMEVVKRLEGEGEFSFDVNEDFHGVLVRAEGFQARKAAKEAEKARKKKGKQQGGPERGEKKFDEDPDAGMVDGGKPEEEAAKEKQGLVGVVFCNNLEREIKITTHNKAGGVDAFYLHPGKDSKVVPAVPGQTFVVRNSDTTESIILNHKVPKKTRGRMFVQVDDPEDDDDEKVPLLPPAPVPGGTEGFCLSPAMLHQGSAPGPGGHGVAPGIVSLPAAFGAPVHAKPLEVRKSHAEVTRLQKMEEKRLEEDNRKKHMSEEEKEREKLAQAREEERRNAAKRIQEEKDRKRQELQRKMEEKARKAEEEKQKAAMRDSLFRAASSSHMLAPAAVVESRGKGKALPETFSLQEEGSFRRPPASLETLPTPLAPGTAGGQALPAGFSLQEEGSFKRPPSSVHSLPKPAAPGTAGGQALPAGFSLQEEGSFKRPPSSVHSLPQPAAASTGGVLASGETLPAGFSLQDEGSFKISNLKPTGGPAGTMGLQEAGPSADTVFAAPAAAGPPGGVPVPVSGLAPLNENRRLSDATALASLTPM